MNVLILQMSYFVLSLFILWFTVDSKLWISADVAFFLKCFMEKHLRIAQLWFLCLTCTDGDSKYCPKKAYALPSQSQQSNLHPDPGLCCRSLKGRDQQVDVSWKPWNIILNLRTLCLIFCSPLCFTSLVNCNVLQRAVW